MKISNKLTSLFFLLVTIFAIQIFAQDKPMDEPYLFHQDIVKIDKVEQYETITKELFEVFKKYGMEGSVKYAFKTDDNKYNFLSPLGSYADLDNRSGHWTNLSKKAGSETLSKIFAVMDETYVSHKDYIIKRSADHSYMPENQRLDGEEDEFVHFDHYYFKEGKMDEAMKIMKEFKEMMIERKSDDAFNVWIYDIGEEYGHVVVTRLAKNGADYYEQSAKRWKSMDEEMKEMWPKFSALLKHFDHHNGSRIPEFIYIPKE